MVPVRAAVVMVACAFVALPQHTEILKLAGQIDDLVNQGKYDLAFSRIRTHSIVARTRGQDASPLLLYTGKLLVEVGKLQTAEEVLRSVELGPVFGHLRGALERERAALKLATGEYGAAATAARACAEFSQRYYHARTAYCSALQAEAYFRSGDVGSARKAIQIALDHFPQNPKKASFFLPRILFSSCLIESAHEGSPDAETSCRRGLELVENSKIQSRDLSLGYVVLAEVRLKRRDYDGTRQAASRVLHIVKDLLGSDHQDAVRAREILARLELIEGKPDAAARWANEGIAIAQRIFGPNSPRTLELQSDMATLLSTKDVPEPQNHP